MSKIELKIEDNYDTHIDLLIQFLNEKIKKYPSELFLIHEKINDNLYNLNIKKDKFDNLINKMRKLSFWNKHFAENIKTYTDNKYILIINQNHKEDEKPNYLSSRLTYKNKHKTIYKKEIIEYNYLKDYKLIYMSPSYEKIDGEVGIDFPIKLKYLAENIEEREIFYIGNKHEEFAVVFVTRNENDKISYHLRFYLNNIGSKFKDILSTLLN